MKEFRSVSRFEAMREAFTKHLPHFALRGAGVDKPESTTGKGHVTLVNDQWKPIEQPQAQPEQPPELDDEAD